MQTFMLHQQDDGADWEVFVVGDYARTVNRFPSLAAAAGWLAAREQEQEQKQEQMRARGHGDARLTLLSGGRGAVPLASRPGRRLSPRPAPRVGSDRPGAPARRHAGGGVGSNAEARRRRRAARAVW
jgi:hypothetical protein